MKYIVIIEKEKIDHINFAVKTQSKSNTELPQKGCLIELSISKNALLGLGKELIRHAHKKEDEGKKHWHFDPLGSTSSPVQTFGVFLAPESVELIIMHTKKQ